MSRYMGKKNTFLLKSEVAMATLSFLSNYPDEEYSSAELIAETGKSRMGIYLGLMLLHNWKLIDSRTKGGRSLYRVNHDNPIVKQYKILNSLIDLNTLTEQLEQFSKKVVLYGSVSRGEDTVVSDIDLFIYTTQKEEAKKVLEKFKSKRRIQSVIVDVIEFSKMKNQDRAYYDEVMQGIVLWEEKK